MLAAGTSSHISFNGHVKKLISKAGKRVGMVGRLRDNFDIAQC